MSFNILITEPEKDYELLDSGNGEKLERYGTVIISRPDPQVLWPKHLPDSEWQKAQAKFLPSSSSLVTSEKEESAWKFNSSVPKKWEINFSGLKFAIKLGAFKHTGLFPEQKNNWLWLEKIIKASGEKRREKIKILNLFGYTGGATLACAGAGANVVHLDGSKTAITSAKENAKLSGLHDKPIRWILDDARVFLKREIKRGNIYDGIVMDPPAFGRGPHGEVWKIEDDFQGLLELCSNVLSSEPVCFLINGYASGYSALAYKNSLEEMLQSKLQKNISCEYGELAIQESVSKRLLPAGIFARFTGI